MRASPRWVLSLAILGLLVFASRVSSSVGVLGSGADTPFEVRVALAVGPERSTLWAQLVIEADGGPVALIVPAEAGASLDWSAPAWFEALEITTAPWILPPVDPGAECAGVSWTPEQTGDSAHFTPVSAQALDVLADADAVIGWAQSHGLDIPTDLPSRLDALGPSQFVAVAFQPQAGRIYTPVLRVVSPTPSPRLPLLLTTAATEEVLVTSWLFGSGGARIDGAATAAIEAELLTFDRQGHSNYAGLRLDALRAAGIGAALTESSSHASIAEGTPVGGDTSAPLLDTYFERSAQQGTGAADAAACIAAARSAWEQGMPVATSCPRADLGVVAGSDSCVENVGASEIDPQALRCGDGTDDLAVALSGLSPASTWLTRISQRIAAESAGRMAEVSFGSTSILHPVLQAMRASCRPDRIPVYEVDSGGCGDPELGPVLYWVEVEVLVEEEEEPDAYYVEEEGDCGGDPGEPQESDAYDEQFGVEDGEASDPEGGDDCGGDSESTAGDSGEDCGGDSGSTAGSGGGETGGETTAESDSGDGSGCSNESSDSSSDDGCGKSESSDSDSDCSLARKNRVRRPRLSLLLFCAVALLVPLRRLTGRRRR